MPATWYSGDPVSFSLLRYFTLNSATRSLSAAQDGTALSSTDSSAGSSSISPTLTIKSSGAGSSRSFGSSATSSARKSGLGCDRTPNLLFYG